MKVRKMLQRSSKDKFNQWEEGKKRMPYWDNVRFFLILLVVIGHFSDRFAEEVPFYKSVFISIYAFHMPLFLMISGLFTRPFRQEDEFPREKVFGYVFLGLLLKLVQFGIRRMENPEAGLSLLEESSVPWYLFVLAGYLTLTYFLRTTRKSHVLLAGILLGMMSGYDTSIKDTFALSRFLVFFPFFLLGYYGDPRKWMEILKRHKWSTWAGRAILLF